MCVCFVVSFEKQDSSGSKGFVGFGCSNGIVRKRINKLASFATHPKLNQALNPIPTNKLLIHIMCTVYIYITLPGVMLLA